MSRNPTLQDTGGGETLAHRVPGNSLQPRLRASSNAKSLFVSRSGGVPYAMAHFGQARAVTRAAFAAVLCLALLAGRCCRGAVPQESNSRRRILQSGFSREAQLEWFRSAGMRCHFPPPLFKKKKSIPCSFPSPSLCPELTSRPRKHTNPLLPRQTRTCRAGRRCSRSTSRRRRKSLSGPPRRTLGGLCATPLRSARKAPVGGHKAKSKAGALERERQPRSTGGFGQVRGSGS